MPQRLSYPFHTGRIQSEAGRWRFAAGALLLGVISGCASSGGPENEATTATPAQPAVADTRQHIDQRPIATQAAADNSEPKTDDRIADAPEEKDMTVLVLDNPELMAHAAQVQASNAQVNAMDDSPRKPHQMKFYFGFDKHRLSEEDQAILRKHAAYMKAHPEVTVSINGHTDSHGPEEYNAFLSRLRANSAAKILKSEGIDESRIEVVGWGSRKPLTNPEDSAANRRLDLDYHSEQMAKAQ